MGVAIRLLIVDDEVPFLQAVARRLEMRGFDVTTATNGTDALAVADTLQFDLALVDLKMPGMNGRDVLATLKARHRFLEVIMLTGHGSLDSAVECTKMGAFGYLPKPYDLDQLIEVLKDAYAHRMRLKFADDEHRTQQLLDIAVGSSPLAILRAMHELDTDER